MNSPRFAPPPCSFFVRFDTEPVVIGFFVVFHVLDRSNTHADLRFDRVSTCIKASSSSLKRCRHCSPSRGLALIFNNGILERVFFVTSSTIWKIDRIKSLKLRYEGEQRERWIVRVLSIYENLTPSAPLSEKTVAWPRFSNSCRTRRNSFGSILWNSKTAKNLHLGRKCWALAKCYLLNVCHHRVKVRRMYKRFHSSLAM